jgi:pimeloyl-ACP methyl ester carboxylesterase
MVTDVGGVLLHVVDRGDGEPPLLLLAGVAGQCADWASTLALLADWPRAVGYDRPGLGDSPPSSAFPTLDGEVGRIGAVVARFGLDRPILIAHSAAAFFAEAYARRHPAAVAGLVLVDPSVEFRTRPRGRLGSLVARRAARIGAAVAHGADLSRLPRLAGPAIWRAAAASMTRRGRPPDDAARVYRRGSVAASAYTEWLAYRDWAADLARLRRHTPVPAAPTVVLTALGRLRSGRARSRWQAAHARLTAMFPNARQVILHDAGHLVGFDRPDAIVDAVSAVIDHAQTSAVRPVSGGRTGGRPRGP